MTAYKFYKVTHTDDNGFREVRHFSNKKDAVKLSKELDVPIFEVVVPNTKKALCHWLNVYMSD